LDNNLKTSTGAEIVKAKDGGSSSPEDGWIVPAVNPFLHLCCDCGLAHQVQYAFVNAEGEDQDPVTVSKNDETLLLALRFSRDGVETARVRAHLEAKKTLETVAVARVKAFLVDSVPPGCVEGTFFSGVAIQDLDREDLLRLVALLAAGKKEESRIILL
jgi:hypothetical protein